MRARQGVATQSRLTFIGQGPYRWSPTNSDFELGAPLTDSPRLARLFDRSVYFENGSRYTPIQNSGRDPTPRVSRVDDGCETTPERRPNTSDVGFKTAEDGCETPQIEKEIQANAGEAHGDQNNTETETKEAQDRHAAPSKDDDKNRKIPQESRKTETPDRTKTERETQARVQKKTRPRQGTRTQRQRILRAYILGLTEAARQKQKQYSNKNDYNIMGEKEITSQFATGTLQEIVGVNGIRKNVVTHRQLDEITSCLPREDSPCHVDMQSYTRGELSKTAPGEPLTMPSQDDMPSSDTVSTALTLNSRSVRSDQGNEAHTKTVLQQVQQQRDEKVDHNDDATTQETAGVDGIRKNTVTHRQLDETTSCPPRKDTPCHADMQSYESICRVMSTRISRKKIT